MPLCLSFFPRKDEAVLRNHAHYCRLFGYAHQWIEADRIRHPALRDSARYGQILRHLRALPENDWLCSSMETRWCSTRLPSKH